MKHPNQIYKLVSQYQPIDVLKRHILIIPLSQTLHILMKFLFKI